jgi:hypothetical protein
MEKFLYLTKTEWQNAWLNGGTIPINLASEYLRQERGSIYTPDETLIHDSPVDLTLIPVLKLSGINLTMIGNIVDGQRIPDFRNASLLRQDGNILSFCDVASTAIAKQLKKVCCVKIFDLSELKKIIDAQLGVLGESGPCVYTAGHQRGHFLKSTEDAWQREYRLFWHGNENKKVTIPAGIAEPICLQSRA